MRGQTSICLIKIGIKKVYIGYPCWTLFKILWRWPSASVRPRGHSEVPERPTAQDDPAEHAVSMEQLKRKMLLKSRFMDLEKRWKTSSIGDQEKQN